MDEASQRIWENMQARRGRISEAEFWMRIAGFDPNRAVEGTVDFVRKKLRDDGFFRKILPPVPISDEQLGLSPTALVVDEM